MHVYTYIDIYRVYTYVHMHKGATGLSRRLIYRRARYRAPRATICRCVVLMLIEMYLVMAMTIERCVALREIDGIVPY